MLNTAFRFYYSCQTFLSINRELKKYPIEAADNVNIEDCAICEYNDIDNDTVIAHMLQDQYNKEYDRMLKRTEEKFNKDAKGRNLSSDFLL